MSFYFIIFEVLGSLTLYSCIGHVSTRLFFSEHTKVQATYQKNAIVIFFSNFSSYKDYSFKSIYVELYGTGENVAAGGNAKFESQESTHFGMRLSAAVFDAKSTGLRVFMLFIFDASFDDNVKFSATVLYKDMSTGIKSITSITELEVVGGPIECGIKLPAITNVNTTGIQQIETVLCGKPTPNVTWYIGDEIATSSHNAIGKAKYRFLLLLSHVTPGMCGTKVTFHAKGHNGVHINGATLLNVIFKPSVALDLSYRLNSYCVRIEWREIDIGTCTGLIYQVQYLDQSNKSIGASNHSHPESKHVYCKGDINDIKDVQIRAVFNGKEGTWSRKEVSLVKPKLATQKQELGKIDEDDDEWKDWAIIGGVLGGLLLIGIILLFIYCCCCAACLICCGCKNEKGKPTDSVRSFGLNEKKRSKKTKNEVVLVAAPTDPALVYSNSQAKRGEQTASEPKFFDPSEFGMESGNTTSRSAKTTNKEDKGRFDHKPSMLI